MEWEQASLRCVFSFWPGVDCTTSELSEHPLYYNRENRTMLRCVWSPLNHDRYITTRMLVVKLRLTMSSTATRRSTPCTTCHVLIWWNMDLLRSWYRQQMVNRLFTLYESAILLSLTTWDHVTVLLNSPVIQVLSHLGYVFNMYLLFRTYSSQHQPIR